MASLKISPSELYAKIESGSTPHLVHLLSDEAFAEKRIPGSLHVCVYEVAFIDKISEQVPDKASPVVVYGLSDSFGAAALAEERMLGAGYENVSSLTGGLDAWEQSGFGLEGEGASVISDGSYDLDPEQSVFRWTGRNLFNQHNGRIAFKSGQLDILDGQLSGGAVVLDMNQITCSDLDSPGMVGALISHLGTDDFFSVSDFPEAAFKMSNAEPIADAMPGGHNLLVHGSLTLRGVEQLVTIKAQLVVLGEKLGLQGQFDVDRTRFGSVYGSGKIFEKLGQHVVNDLISVSFQIICPI